MSDKTPKDQPAAAASTETAEPKAETVTETKPAKAAAKKAEPKAATGEAKAPVRREAVGVVTSTKAAKTIVVRVERRVPHPRFKKIIRLSKKFHAHDEEGRAAEGDKVRIRECRPVSKTKTWELVDVLKH